MRVHVLTDQEEVLHYNVHYFFDNQSFENKWTAARFYGVSSSSSSAIVSKFCYYM